MTNMNSNTKLSRKNKYASKSAPSSPRNNGDNKNYIGSKSTNNLLKSVLESTSTPRTGLIQKRVLPPSAMSWKFNLHIVGNIEKNAYSSENVVEKTLPQTSPIAQINREKNTNNPDNPDASAHETNQITNKDATATDQPETIKITDQPETTEITDQPETIDHSADDVGITQPNNELASKDTATYNSQLTPEKVTASTSATDMSNTPIQELLDQATNPNRQEITPVNVVEPVNLPEITKTGTNEIHITNNDNSNSIPTVPSLLESSSNSNNNPENINSLADNIGNIPETIDSSGNIQEIINSSGTIPGPINIIDISGVELQLNVNNAQKPLSVGSIDLGIIDNRTTESTSPREELIIPNNIGKKSNTDTNKDKDKDDELRQAEPVTPSTTPETIPVIPMRHMSLNGQVYFYVNQETDQPLLISCDISHNFDINDTELPCDTNEPLSITHDISQTQITSLPINANITIAGNLCINSNTYNITTGNTIVLNNIRHISPKPENNTIVFSGTNLESETDRKFVSTYFEYSGKIELDDWTSKIHWHTFYNPYNYMVDILPDETLQTTINNIFNMDLALYRRNVNISIGNVTLASDTGNKENVILPKFNIVMKKQISGGGIGNPNHKHDSIHNLRIPYKSNRNTQTKIGNPKTTPGKPKMAWEDKPPLRSNLTNDTSDNTVLLASLRPGDLNEALVTSENTIQTSEQPNPDTSNNNLQNAVNNGLPIQIQISGNLITPKMEGIIHHTFHLIPVSHPNQESEINTTEYMVVRINKDKEINDLPLTYITKEFHLSGDVQTEDNKYIVRFDNTIELSIIPIVKKSNKTNKSTLTIKHFHVIDPSDKHHPFGIGETKNYTFDLTKDIDDKSNKSKISYDLNSTIDINIKWKNLTHYSFVIEPNTMKPKTRRNSISGGGHNRTVRIR